MKSLKQTYNDIALEWSKRRPVEWMQNSIDKFVSFINPGGYILDVGCGSGDKSAYMVEKGLNVIGIDFSEKMIEIAKREVPKGEFHVMDLNKLEDLNKEFDGIFARAVLLHIPKKEIPNMLSKLKNLLKDHGYLYIAVKEKRESENDEEVVKENDYDSDIERFFSYFTLPELEKLLLDANFTVVFSEITKVKSGTRKWIQIIAQK